MWPDDPPRDAEGRLVTVAWRKFLDAARADTSRRHREGRVEGEPLPGPGEVVDDRLPLYFLCAHPSLTPASAVAPTLRVLYLVFNEGYSGDLDLAGEAIRLSRQIRACHRGLSELSDDR